jgi:hypothetical protein
MPLIASNIANEDANRSVQMSRSTWKWIMH